MKERYAVSHLADWLSQVDCDDSSDTDEALDEPSRALLASYRDKFSRKRLAVSPVPTFLECCTGAQVLALVAKLVLCSTPLLGTYSGQQLFGGGNLLKCVRKCSRVVMGMCWVAPQASEGASSRPRRRREMRRWRKSWIRCVYHTSIMQLHLLESCKLNSRYNEAASDLRLVLSSTSGRISMSSK